MEFLNIKPTTWGVIVLSGLPGIGIITGIAYALPKIGVAVGLSAIIAGQMVIAWIVDTLGLTGKTDPNECLQNDWHRIVGICNMGITTEKVMEYM